MRRLPDYNLGRAHGTIKIDYDGSGAEKARKDIEDVGEEATESSEKIDKSTKQSSDDYDALAASAKKAAESLDFDTTSTDQMAASVRRLEKDVADASAASYAARAKLEAAEQRLAATRERSGATAKEVAQAEAAVRRAQQSTVTAVQRLEDNTQALTLARQRLANVPPMPTPRIDDGNLRQFVSHLQAIQANTRVSSSLLNTFSGRIRLVAGGVAILSPQIAGLAVSLVALAGTAGVAAGALAGMAAVGGTVATGLSGVGDAFKASAQQAKAAGGSAASSARAQRSAARAIEDAKRSLTDAEENLRRVQEDSARAIAQAVKQVARAQRDLEEAQYDAIRAQEALNRARRQAVRDLEDLAFTLRGGSLDERQAVLDVKEAYEELQGVLRDPTANADDIEQATVNYEKAKLALDEARLANQRLAVDAAAAAAAGVEGSDEVRNAQDGVKNSMQGVADAQESLREAQEGVRQAQVDAARQISDAVQGVIDAQRNLAEAYVDAADAGASSGGAADKFAEAMAKLSPNARAFVSEVLDLKDAWEDVKRSVQDRLFAGLAEEVKPLANIYFPLLKEGMGGIADGLNSMVKETVAYLKTAEAQANIKNIFDNTGQAVKNMSGIVRDLLAAFLDIASVGSDFLPDLATGAADAAARFREFISAAKESGALRQWMQDGMDAASQLWELLSNLGSIIGTVFSALDQQGGGALNTLTKLTGQVEEFLKSAEGQEALAALGKALAAIGGAYGKVFLSFLMVAGELLVALSPLIVAFADAAGTYLAGAIQVLGAVLGPLADILGFLGPALGPVVAGIWAANKAVDAAILIWRALNIVMMANPFLVIAAAIITLVILIIQNWDDISKFLSEVWTWISDLAVTVWNEIVEFFKRIWNEIKTSAENLWNGILNFFKRIWNEIKTSAQDLWNGIVSFFKRIWDEIVSSAKTAFNNVVKFFKDLPGNIGRFLGEMVDKAVQFGKDIIAGIVRGLGNAARWIWDKLKKIVSEAWDSVLSFFGISSPSKLAAEAGENIVAGLVRGMDRSSDQAVRAAADMAAAVGNELTGATGSLAAQVNLMANTSGLPDGLGMDAAITSLGTTTAVARGGEGAAAGGGRTVIIENVNLTVQGNLDPTNPVAWRRTIIRIKDDLRSVDKEYK